MAPSQYRLFEANRLAYDLTGKKSAFKVLPACILVVSSAIS